MGTSLTLNSARELIGLPVYATGSSQVLGEVIDILIEPKQGKFLGFELYAQDGVGRMIPACRFAVCVNSVSVDNANTRSESHGDFGPVEGVRALSELYGTEVVTNDGRFLGRVVDIQVTSGDGKVFYSLDNFGPLRRLFGRNFTIEASDAHWCSRTGSRLIVPHDAYARVTEKTHDVDSPLSRRARNAARAIWDLIYRDSTVIWFLVFIVILEALLFLMC